MNENEQVEVQQAAEQEVEKTLPQSKVNDLIRQEKEAAKLRAQQEYEAQLQDYKNQLNELKNSSQVGGMTNNLNIDDIYSQLESRFRQQAERQQNEYAEQQKREQMEQVAANYYRNLDTAKDKYEDFESVMAEFDPKAFPELVMLTSDMENGGDVAYHVIKSPEKLANFMSMATRDPNMARKMLAKIGSSIAQNQQAQANYQAAPAPLSKMQSTHGGVNQPAPSSVRELRSKDYLRG